MAENPHAVAFTVAATISIDIEAGDRKPGDQERKNCLRLSEKYKV